MRLDVAPARLAGLDADVPVDVALEARQLRGIFFLAGGAADPVEGPLRPAEPAGEVARGAVGFGQLPAEGDDRGRAAGRAVAFVPGPVGRDAARVRGPRRTGGGTPATGNPPACRARLPSRRQAGWRRWAGRPSPGSPRPPPAPPARRRRRRRAAGAGDRRCATGRPSAPRTERRRAAPRWPLPGVPAGGRASPRRRADRRRRAKTRRAARRAPRAFRMTRKASSSTP